MGDVYADITLRNGGDIVLARGGYIPEQNIRSITTTALVDTGTMALVMGDSLRKELGLAITASDSVILADGSEIPCGVTEPVEVRWEDRISLLRAWVLSDDEEVLLGVMPLEEMDLIVDPGSQTLVRPPKPRRRGTGYMRLK